MTLKITTSESADTSAVGAAIASLLKGGETVELTGDIGSGKTTLARGLIAAMGFSADVPSPTFTLERDYPVRNGLTVRHYDFYRLVGHDVVSDEMLEAMADPKTISIVEWAAHGDARLPKDRIRIDLAFGKAEKQRELKIEAPGNQDLIRKLQHDFGAQNR